jgi:hypothetical protein
MNTNTLLLAGAMSIFASTSNASENGNDMRTIQKTPSKQLLVLVKTAKQLNKVDLELIALGYETKTLDRRMIEVIIPSGTSLHAAKKTLKEIEAISQVASLIKN